MKWCETRQNCSGRSLDVLRRRGLGPFSTRYCRRNVERMKSFRREEKREQLIRIQSSTSRVDMQDMFRGLILRTGSTHRSISWNLRRQHIAKDSLKEECNTSSGGVRNYISADVFMSLSIKWLIRTATAVLLRDIRCRPQIPWSPGNPSPSQYVSYHVVTFGSN